MARDYWTGAWPNLSSISIILDDPVTDGLSPLEIGILYRLVHVIACHAVHTFFSGPSLDPSLPAKRTEIMCRLARCSEREWRRARSSLVTFFDVDDAGNWRLRNTDFIRITREPAARNAIPTAIKGTVRERDGDRCTYCGSTEGPFHLDHIFPVAKGGRDVPSNLTLACVPCNLAKRDMTLEEWIASRILRVRVGDG